jgi:hypothetical protein
VPKQCVEPPTGAEISALTFSVFWIRTFSGESQSLQSWIECLMMSVLWAELKRTQSIEKPNFLPSTSDQGSWGSWDTFQPPPKACTRRTAAVMRWPRIWISVNSSVRAIVCTVITLR